MAVKFEANSIAQPKAVWMPVSEAFVRRHLATETPDPELQDLIMRDMTDHESEADDGILVFRAVNVINEADYRIAYTQADPVYFGFGTVILDDAAGTDKRGRTVRKVGIKPEHWAWQTERFGSGMFQAVEPHDLDKFRDIWTLKG